MSFWKIKNENKFVMNNNSSVKDQSELSKKQVEITRLKKELAKVNSELNNYKDQVKIQEYKNTHDLHQLDQLGKVYGLVFEKPCGSRYKIDAVETTGNRLDNLMDEIADLDENNLLDEQVEFQRIITVCWSPSYKFLDRDHEGSTYFVNSFIKQDYLDKNDSNDRVLGYELATVKLGKNHDKLIGMQENAKSDNDNLLFGSLFASNGLEGSLWINSTELNRTSKM